VLIVVIVAAQSGGERGRVRVVALAAFDCLERRVVSHDEAVIGLLAAGQVLFQPARLPSPEFVARQLAG
jgi:hypothetical protein